MVEVSGWKSWVFMFGLAAILGAVGGLAYELMQTRRRQTGMFEIPRRVGADGRIGYWDLGGFASMVIGAVAAVASLWIFPPEAVRVIKAGVTPARQWDVVKLVGLSLIVGSAGASFLSALQARAIAIVKTQEAATTRKVAKAGINTIEAGAKAGADHTVLASLTESAKRSIDSSTDGNPDGADF